MGGVSAAQGAGIEGLDELPGACGPELTALRHALVGLLGPGTRVLRFEQFESRVTRLHLETAGRRRSLIVKRLDPVVAHRNRMLTERWLPAVGLEALGPGLLASAADREGRRSWQVYEDWGDAGLDRGADRRRARAAARAIAELHLRFADHPLLGECRLWGGDLGMGFYGSNARDALRALEALGPAATLPERTEAARQRLLDQLQGLLDEEGERARALEELGGPETLVHGDLWPMNVFVLEADDGPRVRLIDWDHAAVARFPYDLSTFLIRFPIGRRPQILADYAERVADGGWRLADERALNGLFGTAERARIASHVVWPALALLRGEARLRDWALATLAEVSGWFDALEPVLPCARGAAA